MRIQFLSAISLVAAGALLFSCNKSENVTPMTGNGMVTVSASMSETKAYGSDKGRFYWEKGDKIGIWTGSGLTEFTLDTPYANMTYGKFKGTVPEGSSISENSFAVYPYDGVSIDGTAVTLPSYGSLGDYPVRSAYLYSTKAPELEAEDGVAAKFAFNHLTAYFRVTLKNIQASAKGVFLECYCPNATGNNKYFLMGGSVDLSSGVPELTPNTADWMFVKFPEHSGVIESLTLQLPIVPGTYGANAKFRIVAVKDINFGNEMDGTNFVGYLELNPSAGDFYVLPDITFPNEKSADDTGSGVNDGIEDSVVNDQADDFWKVGA